MQYCKRHFGGVIVKASARYNSNMIVGSILVPDPRHSLKESVNALPKVVGFFLEPRFPSAENVDKPAACMGWDKSLIN